MTKEEAIEILEEARQQPIKPSGYWKAIDMAIKALNAQEWIPCSERLPSDNGNYLITVADFRLEHIGEHTVTIADFYAKEKKWNSVVEVLAWKPLPKPYKAESEQ